MAWYNDGDWGNLPIEETSRLLRELTVAVNERALLMGLHPPDYIPGGPPVGTWVMSYPAEFEDGLPTYKAVEMIHDLRIRIEAMVLPTNTYSPQFVYYDEDNNTWEKYFLDDLLTDAGYGNEWLPLPDSVEFEFISDVRIYAQIRRALDRLVYLSFSSGYLLRPYGGSRHEPAGYYPVPWVAGGDGDEAHWDAMRATIQTSSFPWVFGGSGGEWSAEVLKQTGDDEWWDRDLGPYGLLLCGQHNQIPYRPGDTWPEVIGVTSDMRLDVSLPSECPGNPLLFHLVLIEGLCGDVSQDAITLTDGVLTWECDSVLHESKSFEIDVDLLPGYTNPVKTFTWTVPVDKPIDPVTGSIYPGSDGDWGSERRVRVDPDNTFLLSQLIIETDLTYG